MNTQIFNSLLDQSRLLTVLHDNLSEDIKRDQLYQKIIHYTEKYILFNKIDPEKVIDIYSNFIGEYNKHCKLFISSRKYPLENGTKTFSITREEYDIVLLLSVLFTPHRFRIMQLLNEKNISERSLFIGLGPGLELSITRPHIKEIHAYDLSISKFLSSEFSSVQFHEELYNGQKQNYFDSVYLIELLEHVKDPFTLMEICFRSLKKGGKAFLTTATDIPQFDHLYNFPKDHGNFEEQMKQIGFSIQNKEMIPHNYLTMDLKPCNHFYTLKKI